MNNNEKLQAESLIVGIDVNLLNLLTSMHIISSTAYNHAMGLAMAKLQRLVNAYGEQVYQIARKVEDARTDS